MFATVLFFAWSFLVVVLVQWAYFLVTRPKNAPPGPLPLPLIGSVYVFFFRNDCEAFKYLYEKYGDVVTIYAGSSVSGLMVFVFGYDAILEVANSSDIASVTSGRLHGINQLRGVKEGILWAQYPEARERRTLLHKGFKQYGLLAAKLSLQEEQEMDRLLETVTANAGQPFDPTMALTEAVSSSLLLAVYGHRFDRSDQTCAALYRAFQIWFSASRLEMFLLHYLRYLKPFIHDKSAEAEITAERILEKWLAEEIAVRRPTFNPDNIRDLLDVYLANSQDGKLEDWFLRTVVDTFAGSTDTTSEAIGWALFYLALMPEEQERLRKEIESVVPANLYPTMENRNELPRLRAFLEESARFSSMAVSGFPRRCSEQITFGPGKCFQIPAESTITIVMYPNQFEEKYWLDPNNFRVNRWLDPIDGTFLTSRRPILQFGAGRRNCPGEIPARNMVLLTVGSFIQRFQWKLAEHVPFTAKNYRLTVCPPAHQLVFTPRT